MRVVMRSFRVENVDQRVASRQQEAHVSASKDEAPKVTRAATSSTRKTTSARTSSSKKTSTAVSKTAKRVVKRVASAVGEGAMAIRLVHQFLNELNNPAAGER